MSLILIGDIHSDFGYIEHLVQASGVINHNLVQVGDFGVGFDDAGKLAARLKSLNNVLQNTGNTLWVIRGNHDDPAYFGGTDVLKARIGEVALEFEFSNINFLKDYSCVDFKSYSMFCVGGAYSIDRSRREEGIGYWADEIVQEIPENLPSDKELVVVTHTCPNEGIPVVTNMSYIERITGGGKAMEDFLKGSTRERNILSTLKDRLLANGNRILRWYNGHFHVYKQIVGENGIIYTTIASNFAVSYERHLEQD